MTERCDVAVVGARIAGSALAIHLARAGVDVRVFDKARFPSDTASTHIIQPRGSAALDRLGVLDDLRAAGAADIDGIVLQYADARLEARYADPRAIKTLSTGNTPGLSLRRQGLDAVLMAAAQRAGVDVHTSCAVDGVLRNRAGRVTGLRTAAGDVEATLVIGADGRASTVATDVGARRYETYCAARMAAWAYFEGAADDANRLRIGRVADSALIATPAGEGLLLVGAVPDADRREEFLADRGAYFDDEVRRWPELHGLLAGARRVGPMRVVPDWQAYFRESAGPGWVLVGDAGNFKDPAAAQGITDALRQGEALASSVTEALAHGPAAVDRATTQWARWRDEDCRDMHWFARDMGAAGPTTPVMAQIVRDIAASDPFLLAAVLNRDLPSTAVVTPSRVLGSAARAIRRDRNCGPRLVREGARQLATGARRASWRVRRGRVPAA